ncbi:MAG: DUF805 domain-containing protein [Phycisphaerales bacterium JB040]
MEMYLQAWKRTMDFQGRSRRSEYWTFTLLNVVVFFGLGLVGAVTSSADSISPVIFLAWAFNLAILLPSLSVSVRRLHDLGKSGFWMLSLLVPFVNIIASLVLLVMFCMDSQPGANKYGPSPKGDAGFDANAPVSAAVPGAFARPMPGEGEGTFAKSA